MLEEKRISHQHFLSVQQFKTDGVPNNKKSTDYLTSLVKSAQQRAGYELGNKQRRIQCRKICRTTIFANVKFASTQALRDNGTIARKVMFDMGYQPQEREQFLTLWNEQLKPICRKEMNSKRSCVSQCIGVWLARK